MKKSKLFNLHSDTDKRYNWHHALILSGVSILFLFVAYWQTFYEIVDIWLRSDTFKHGFIVFPIVIYLLWNSRIKSYSTSPQTSVPGILILLVFNVLWFVGYITDLGLLKHLSFIAMIPAIFWSLLGGKFIKNNIFPMAYLFFAVPMGEFLIPQLQDITASMSVYLLRLSNVPVVLEGRYFYIPNGSFEVAQACSGIRYLIATLTVGSLYAYFMYASFWRRLLFMLLAIFVPIIANGIRAYGIVMLANFSDYKYAIGFDHVIYGWIFFGVVIFLLFWIGSLFLESKQGVMENKRVILLKENIEGKKQNYLYPFVVLLILSLAPLTLSWRDRWGNDESYESFTIPVLNQKGWQGPYESDDAWRPHFNGATQEYRVAYSRAGENVEVYLAYYQKQQQDREMINVINRFYNKKQFTRINEFTQKLKFDNGTDISVRARELRSKISTRIMYDWYLIDTTPTINILVAKLLEARSKFSSKKKGSLAIAITAETSNSDEESIQLLNEFVADFYPSLRANMAVENQTVAE